MKNTILFLLLLAGCSYIDGSSEVVIKNNSSNKLTDVSIEVSGEIVWEGDIEKGGQAGVVFNIHHDGNIKIIGRINSVKIKSDSKGYGYNSSDISTLHTFTIDDDGLVDYDFK